MKTPQTLPASDINNLIEIVKRLRLECPWDKVQTHQSLAAPLIEEAYEVVEAIENKDFTDLQKELGDVLLHIVFQADLAEEAGLFDLNAVIKTECEKLIYRHPHIFADTKAETSEEVTRNWELLKRKESGRTSILDGVPNSLPALQRAERIQQRAAKVGFDWDNTQDVLKKVREEIDEFLEANTAEHREEEFGDLLFSLVNFSRHSGIEAERALRNATIKFDKRFRFVEQKVELSGKNWEDHNLEQLDTFWNEAKL